MLTAEIIAVGTELLTPRFQDTNSLFVTAGLNQAGIDVVMKTIAGDQERYLEEAIRRALERTPLVITIGGLGPTEDDITRKVVAQVTHRQLVLDDRILRALEQRYAARGQTMPANNQRQALVPTGAETLDNPNGSAPGIWLETGKNTLILLPGPPAELEPMFEALRQTRLMGRGSARAIARRIYRTTGLPESALDARIAPIYTSYKNPETTILSKPGEVDVHLTARARTEAEAESQLDELGARIEAELGDAIYARGGLDLEAVVGLALTMKQATIAVAESCTGGLLAERLTRTPGSSRYFQSGIVTYSNASKIDLAGIPPLLIEMDGAVSREVAVGLAESVRERFGTTVGVGVTGVAGPSGGSAEKPVGTVHIAVATPDLTDHRQFLFPGDRQRIRGQAAQAALDMIRRRLAAM